MPRVIETSYAGCRFRSRLEARWAVFFDALGIEWQYEIEGYELPSGWYLPDFHLPNMAAWVEIKGRVATQHEMQLLQELSYATSERVYMLSGDIPRHGPLEPPSRDFQDWPGWWGPSPLVIDRGLQAALNAARSARFEHGASGVR